MLPCVDSGGDGGGEEGGGEEGGGRGDGGGGGGGRDGGGGDHTTYLVLMACGPPELERQMRQTCRVGIYSQK